MGCVINGVTAPIGLRGSRVRSNPYVTRNTKKDTRNSTQGTCAMRHRTRHTEHEIRNKKCATRNTKRTTRVLRAIGKVLRNTGAAYVIFLTVVAPSLAISQEFSNSVASGEVDRFGCEIKPRPDHLTFMSFKDGWRSSAADKLYDLHRYEAAVEAQSCDCDVIRPAWDVIEDDFTSLGFAEGPSSAYDAWADSHYFPVISGLREQVRALCGEDE